MVSAAGDGGSKRLLGMHVVPVHRSDIRRERQRLVRVLRVELDSVDLRVLGGKGACIGGGKVFVHERGDGEARRRVVRGVVELEAGRALGRGLCRRGQGGREEGREEERWEEKHRGRWWWWSKVEEEGSGGGRMRMAGERGDGGNSECVGCW